MTETFVCKECGRQHKRPDCEFCARDDRWWKKHYHNQLTRIFTPRIARDLQNSPPDNLEDDDVRKVRQGTGLFIHGPVGVGKTTYVAAVTMEVLRLEQVEQTKTIIPSKVRFLTAAQFLREVRETYNGPQDTEVGPVQVTEKDVLDRYAQADLLILDDLSYINVTAWAVDILDDLINTRYEQLRPTLMTSNVADLDELATLFDSNRIPSRIAGTSLIYSFDSEDHRVEG